jgi:ribosomal protein S18 acetylase RimI-like enzyme
MSNEVIIRKATVEDAVSLVSLGIKTFYDTFAAVNTEKDMQMYLDSTFTLEKILSEFEEKGSLFFIGESEGVSVGYAKIRTLKREKGVAGQSPLEIERLYVREDQFGKGTAHKLMQTCLDYAMQNNFDCIWLGVWEHNERAKSFYKKWGFEIFGEHVFVLGTDPQTDLLMQRKI